MLTKLIVNYSLSLEKILPVRLEGQERRCFLSVNKNERKRLHSTRKLPARPILLVHYTISMIAQSLR